MSRPIQVMVVKNHPDETIESMIRRFKKKVRNAGFLDELKENRYYIKPSLAKREKAKNARHG